MLKSGEKRAMAWGFGGVLARGVIVLFVPTGEWRNGRRAGFRCQCPLWTWGFKSPFAHSEDPRKCKSFRGFFVSGVGVWGGAWVEAEADAELRLLACPLPPPFNPVRHLWPDFGDLSMYSPYLSMVFRHLCARCGPGSLTCRCAIHLWTRCSASIGE